MTIKGIDLSSNTPRIIAGPCSAESYEQLFNTAQKLHKLGVKTVRAGIWKPRTRPNNFEGVGAEALKWIEEIKKQLPLQFAIEVAKPKHVELAIEHGVDVLWVGARTTVNPFVVQEIANSLRGVDKPVMVKNPVNPDLALWEGAIERIAGAGIKEISAIHRGFSSFQKTKYRNEPGWQIPIALKSHLPEIPLICDPSHIGGARNLIFEISQKALDLDYDGLMIETHIEPDKALSDAKQQITPAALEELLGQLLLRAATSSDALFISRLDELRANIDQIDRGLIEALANRMKVVAEIGEYKKENDVTILQLERWNEIIATRPNWGKFFELREDFVSELYKLIHDESILQQTEIFQIANFEADIDEPNP